MGNKNTTSIMGFSVGSLLVGACLGWFFAQDGSPDIQDIARGNGARSAVFIGSNKKLEAYTTEAEPTRIGTCEEREKTKNPCEIKIITVKDNDGKSRLVVVSNDSDQRPILPVRDRQTIEYFKVGSGTCQIYWTITGTYVICY